MTFIPEQVPCTAGLFLLRRLWTLLTHFFLVITKKNQWASKAPIFWCPTSWAIVTLVPRVHPDIFGHICKTAEFSPYERCMRNIIFRLIVSVHDSITQNKHSLYRNKRKYYVSSCNYQSALFIVHLNFTTIITICLYTINN